MKRYSQLNIIHNDAQLHYLAGFDNRTSSVVSMGNYSYRVGEDMIQFFAGDIHNDHPGVSNVIQNLNIWRISDTSYSNLHIPALPKQSILTIYIPRYSVESFYDTTFGGDTSLDLSNLRYVITAYTYIAGIKIILGNYMFSMEDTVATPTHLRYKGEDYMSCVVFNIIDPSSLVYDDDWIPFRTQDCGENICTNNTGSVMELELRAVYLMDEGAGYVEVPGFVPAIACVPFGNVVHDFMHTDIDFTGDAIINITFNEVYNDDIQTYLCETYGLWKKDADENYVDTNGDPVPLTNGVVDSSLLVPGDIRLVYELVILDKEDIFEVHKAVTGPSTSYTFPHSLMEHPWEWYKEGLMMRASVSIYETDLNDIDEIEECCVPVMDLLAEPIPLTQDAFRYLVPVHLASTINIDDINMNEYNVSIVNKLIKNVVTVNRPNDNKTNIVRPVFIRCTPAADITIHPAVTECICLNLNKYKSQVDVFHLKIEGQDFIEEGRSDAGVVFRIIGNNLPNNIQEGIYYILNQDLELVTTGNYKYEQ